MSDAGAQDIAQVQLEYKVRINYKSGHQHVGWFTEFVVNRTDAGAFVGVEYATSDGVKFLLLGVDDIESITQLTSRKKAVKK